MNKTTLPNLFSTENEIKENSYRMIRNNGKQMFTPAGFFIQSTQKETFFFFLLKKNTLQKNEQS